MKSKILKIATIILFFGLISSFVGYKSGLFDSTQIKHPKNSTPTEKDSLKKNKKDSIPDTILSKKKIEIMPSSKSMIIMDPKQEKTPKELKQWQSNGWIKEIDLD